MPKKIKKIYLKYPLKEFQLFEKSITKDIYEYIDVEKSLYRKKTKMSTNPKLVSQKINRYSKLLK
jgi:argininosuccinate lyase